MTGKDVMYWDAYRHGCDAFLMIKTGRWLINLNKFSSAFRTGYFDMSDMWYSVKSAKK